METNTKNLNKKKRRRRDWKKSFRNYIKDKPKRQPKEIETNVDKEFLNLMADKIEKEKQSHPSF